LLDLCRAIDIVHHKRYTPNGGDENAYKKAAIKRGIRT